jgi:hypothetical protein
MTLAWEAHTRPRRGHTIVATGDQREPVVTDENIPVPGGGEYVGALGAIVVRTLRGRGASSLFHGFRCAPPVATIVCPLRGQEGYGCSGIWRVQDRRPAPGNVDVISCRVRLWRGIGSRRNDVRILFNTAGKG